MTLQIYNNKCTVERCYIEAEGTSKIHAEFDISMQ